MRKIVVRFDDVCPTMNLDKFNVAINKLKEYDIKPLLGVVPECKDAELLEFPENKKFWDYITDLSKEGYTIAMHGYTHCYDIIADGIVTKKKKSEFAGHTYEEQYKRIKQGKDILLSHGIDTDIFFAPSHSYDRTTLRALFANGFRFVSDGKSIRPYIQCGIKCIPCRFGGIPRIGENGVYTLVLHTSQWSREDKKYNEKLFMQVVDNYHSDMVDYSVILEEKSGFFLMQKLIEKITFYYEINLKPILYRVYGAIKND